MSNLNNIENIEKTPINIDKITLEKSVMNYRIDNEIEDNSFKYLGLSQLSVSELTQNINNIKDILAGRSVIDFIGTNGLYKTLFEMVAKNRKVTINLIDPSIDVTLIESNMYTDSLIIADLPHYKIDEIVNCVSGKKEIILGDLYIKEAIENSELRK